MQIGSESGSISSSVEYIVISLESSSIDSSLEDTKLFAEQSMPSSCKIFEISLFTLLSIECSLLKEPLVGGGEVWGEPPPEFSFPRIQLEMKTCSGS